MYGTSSIHLLSIIDCLYFIKWLKCKVKNTKISIIYLSHSLYLSFSKTHVFSLFPLHVSTFSMKTRSIISSGHAPLKLRYNFTCIIITINTTMSEISRVQHFSIFYSSDDNNVFRSSFSRLDLPLDVCARVPVLQLSEYFEAAVLTRFLLVLPEQLLQL